MTLLALVDRRQAAQVARQGLAGHLLAGADACSLHFTAVLEAAEAFVDGDYT